MSQPQVPLEDLGWDESWREALLGAALPALSGTALSGTALSGTALPGAALPGAALPGTAAADLPGRIVRVDRGLCTVATESGPVRASPGGTLLEAMAADPVRSPVTGDWCLVREWPDGPLTVETLAPRRTALVRAGSARSSHGQVMAANVDVVAVVVSLHPEPNIGRIERLLAVAWESGATPLVVLTKADLVVDGEAIAEDVRAAAPGVEAVCSSTTTGVGVDRVAARLHGGRTMVMVGASGHGKSTLTNALVGAEVLTTRSIRADGKGRHTSVRRELVVVPGGGVIIDTPGLRGVGLHRDAGALRQAFPDIDRLADQCRFRDCRHETEPGCALRAALASGEVSVRRWESWQRLQRELVWAEARTDARLRSEQEKRWRDLTKQTRPSRRGRPR